MMRSHCLSLLVSLATIFVSPAFGGKGGGQAPTCADNSIVAGAVRTEEDIRVFVECAYELVREVGAVAARQAFHQEERWRRGPIYVFVDENTPNTDLARAFVYPPDPSREGVPWGRSIDAFGNDLFLDAHRIVRDFGEGWLYNSFRNPTSGRDEPKVSYIKGIEWDGVPAFIGAGIYRRDIPATCHGDEVNAAMLDADPSNPKLREFVRCAAMELDSGGYFASVSLANDSRWRSGSIYLFGLDTYGYTLFTGSPANPLVGSELSPIDIGGFGGRNILGVADAFGESFLYYWNRNPATGQAQRKVTFVKRVTSFGFPVLVGAGYYQDSSDPEGSRVVVAGDDAMLGDDDYVLNNATITGDTLTTSVSYGGGCETHVFTLVLSASFIDASPVQLPVFLRHEANGDPCEAWLTQTYTFDLALVRTRYREAYGPGAGRITLKLDGVPADSLVYEFTE